MPRTPPLLAGLVATSVVVTLALGWAGWRLVNQQRELDARLVRDQADAMADAMAAGIRERLADLGERLRAMLAGTPLAVPPAPDIAIVARDTGGRMQIEPEGALPFQPWAPFAPAPSPLFASAEYAELVAGDRAAAIATYRTLVTTSDDTVCASALYRLARALRLNGQLDESLTVSRQLAALGAIPIDTTGIPAELAGLDMQRLALAAKGDATPEQQVRDLIRARLEAGVWTLDRGTALHYRDMVTAASPDERWSLATALADVLVNRLPEERAEGTAVVDGNGTSVTVVWRTAGTAIAMSAVATDALMASVVPAGVGWRLADGGHRVLAGTSGPVPSDARSRLVTAGGATWALAVWPTAAIETATTRTRTIIAGLTAMALFVWGATLLMARAIGRETDAARLQTDFVAAVSHEFRSPLSTMRQMTEMLDADRVPGETKRREYYRVLAGEVSRLQRLVETLLHFGRLEASRTPVARTDVDLASLVAPGSRTAAGADSSWPSTAGPSIGRPVPSLSRTCTPASPVHASARNRASASSTVNRSVETVAAINTGRPSATTHCRRDTSPAVVQRSCAA